MTAVILLLDPAAVAAVIAPVCAAEGLDDGAAAVLLRVTSVGAVDQEVVSGAALVRPARHVEDVAALAAMCPLRLGSPLEGTHGAAVIALVRAAGRFAGVAAFVLLRPLLPGALRALLGESLGSLTLLPLGPLLLCAVLSLRPLALLLRTLTLLRALTLLPLSLLALSALALRSALLHGTRGRAPLLCTCALALGALALGSLALLLCAVPLPSFGLRTLSLLGLALLLAGALLVLSLLLRALGLVALARRPFLLTRGARGRITPFLASLLALALLAGTLALRLARIVGALDALPAVVVVTAFALGLCRRCEEGEEERDGEGVEGSTHGSAGNCRYV